jgi:hypothetical protein
LLLNGLSPITATAGGGLDAITKDLANIAGEISGKGVGGDDMIIVTNPKQAIQLKLLSGAKFNYEVSRPAGLTPSSATLSNVVASRARMMSLSMAAPMASLALFARPAPSRQGSLLHNNLESTMEVKDEVPAHFRYA